MMSDATNPQEVAATASWPVLSPNERRVLGVLVEKNKTSKSPDTYPMTQNSIMVGCNQKSNRDPICDMEDDDVEVTLLDLQQAGLVIKAVSSGGRVERWRHNLYDTWLVTRVELAILAELLLRGPQTVGDLRGRASRMDDIADLDTLKELLTKLVERQLVVYLTSPERRGAAVTHGFHSVEELQQARLQFGQEATSTDSSPSRAGAMASPSALHSLEAKLNEALTEIAALKERVTALEAKS